MQNERIIQLEERGNADFQKIIDEKVDKSIRFQISNLKVKES